jgi:hypothetical protein
MLALGGVHLSAPGDFYHLDSPIPAFQYRISPGSPDSRAEGIHACQDAQTPPGPSMTRTNAMVDVAFPIQAQGRHPKGCDFGAQFPAYAFPCQRFSRHVTIAAA